MEKALKVLCFIIAGIVCVVFFCEGFLCRIKGI